MDASHCAFFLQGFDQLRVEGLLCDVTLVPGDGDEVFPVHRAMMASASDYFKAMFTGGVSVSHAYCYLQIVIAWSLRHMSSKTLDSRFESAQDYKQLRVVVLSLLLHLFFQVKF